MPKHGPLKIFVAHPSDLLTDSEPHGDGLVAWGFINELARRGHQFDIAAPRVAVQGERPPTVNVYDLAVRFRSPIAYRLEVMAKIRRLWRSLSLQGRFSLIHQMNPVHVGLSLAVDNLGIPVVLGPFVVPWPENVEMERGWAANRYRGLVRPVRRMIAHRQQANASALLVTTRAARATLEDPLPPHVGVHSVPLGIDSKIFSPAGLPPDSGSVLFLASLTRRKGIFVLLDAFDRLADQRPDVRLTIAGDGPDADEVKRKVAESRHAPCITMVGHVPRSQVPGLLRSHAIYCLPSLGEPFGMSALEAMACGLPVVATDTGGLACLVQEGGGYKVPPGEVAPLAEALLELLASPQRQKEMGDYNRSLVEREYTWQRAADRVEEVYYRVALRSGIAPGNPTRSGTT